MNNQEKLTPENLQPLQKKLFTYNLAIIITPLFLLGIAFLAIVVFDTGLIAYIISFILFLVYGFVRWILKEEAKIIKKDIKYGFKEIIEGFITKKYLKEDSKCLHINEVEYTVKDKDYHLFKENDYVKLEILPISKTVLNIIAIPQ